MRSQMAATPKGRKPASSHADDRLVRRHVIVRCTSLTFSSFTLKNTMPKQRSWISPIALQSRNRRSSPFDRRRVANQCKTTTWTTWNGTRVERSFVGSVDEERPTDTGSQEVGRDCELVGGEVVEAVPIRQVPTAELWAKRFVFSSKP